MDKPTTGWVTPCVVDRVLDGDTLDLVIRRKVRVRLLDCWAPETRSRDLNEKARGIASRAELVRLVDQYGPDLTLQIPTGNGQEIAEVFTFGRVLGRLWTPAGRELSELMVESGFAEADKK